MKKFLLVIMSTALAIPAVCFAQDDQTDLRLAKLEVIVVTAQKTQPADYKADAKTAALLAEIAKEKK